jgi:hypothetical protein
MGDHQKSAIDHRAVQLSQSVNQLSTEQQVEKTDDDDDKEKYEQPGNWEKKKKKSL